MHRRRARRRAYDEEPGDRHHVDQDDVLQPERVRPLKCKEADEEGDGHEPERRDRDEGGGDEHGRQRERGALAQLAARNRSRALDRVRAVERRVADVVDEVGGAGGGTVARESREGVRPSPGVTELRGEDDSREEQEVLRPLPRPQSNQRGTGGATPRRELEHRCRLVQAHAADGRAARDAAVYCSAGSTSSKRLPRPGSDSSSIRPPSATASSRAIASPSPVPELSCDQNGRKMRSRSCGEIPGPESSTATETEPFSAASSSSTRPPSGVHRKAFESRLEMIWSTRSPSETIVGAASNRLSYSIPRRRASSPNAAY